MKNLGNENLQEINGGGKGWDILGYVDAAADFVKGVRDGAEESAKKRPIKNAFKGWF